MKRRMVAAAMLVALTLGVSACAPSEEPDGAQSATPTDSPNPTPTPPTPPTGLERAAQEVAQLPVSERAARIVMGSASGSDPSALASYVAGGPRGVILMGGNVPGTPGILRQLTDAVHAASDDVLIAIDQEGGDVSRMPWDEFPSSRTLKAEVPAQAQAAFAARARLLSGSGIDINFGVVADVPRSEDSFIYRRSYGTDPQAVAERVSAIVSAERGYVATTLKHFPGHGAAGGDSHHSIPTADLSLADWRSVDAIPFEAGIEAGAELVMMGHLRLTAVSDEPASLAPEWYEILRTELGFTGVAITDDLGMLSGSGDPAYADPVANAVAAVAAGADVALMIAGSTPETAGQIIDGLTQRASVDPVFDARLTEAATRVTALAAKLRN